MAHIDWRHLKSQVECIMIDSSITLEEYKEILAQDNWYEHPELANEKWWFGRGKKELVEVTFLQMRTMWNWMGLDAEVMTGAMRYKITEAVDELIRISAEESQYDLMREHDEAIEEAAA